MRAVSSLPQGYGEILSIDLQKDKKLALLINGLAILIGAVLVVPMLFIVPLDNLTKVEGQFELLPLLLKIGVIAVGIFLYTILHELVHGVAMKICGTKKVKYGFTGLYAFAGSEDYYGKGSYIFIALAPIVLWGIVLAVINIFVPISWFWVVYFIQVMNISGGVGDLFVTFKFAKLPKDILVCDKGVGMQVFSKTADQTEVEDSQTIEESKEEN